MGMENRNYTAISGDIKAKGDWAVLKMSKKLFSGACKVYPSSTLDAGTVALAFGGHVVFYAKDDNGYYDADDIGTCIIKNNNCVIDDVYDIHEAVPIMAFDSGEGDTEIEVLPAIEEIGLSDEDIEDIKSRLRLFDELTAMAALPM